MIQSAHQTRHVLLFPTMRRNATRSGFHRLSPISPELRALLCLVILCPSHQGHIGHRFILRHPVVAYYKSPLARRRQGVVAVPETRGAFRAQPAQEADEVLIKRMGGKVLPNRSECG